MKTKLPLLDVNVNIFEGCLYYNQVNSILGQTQIYPKKL